MSAMQHSQHPLIRDYLQQLQTYLQALTPADAAEVLREIESHLDDVLDGQPDSEQQLAVSTLLNGFGDPRQLAAQYVAHLTVGTPPPQGFKALRTVRQSASMGLYVSMALVGYLLAATLLAVGIAKLLVPQWVGVWSSPGGESVVVGLVREVPAGSSEILGNALSPVFVVLAFGLYWLTRNVLRLLKPYCQAKA